MVKANVRYTLEHFKQMHLIDIPFNLRIMWIVITFASTAVAVFAVLTGEKFFNIFTVLAMALWFGTLAYIIFNYILFNPKKMFEKYNESQPDSHVIFEFGDNALKTTSESRTTNGINEYRYDVFESAWENVGFFVIRIKNAGVFIIKKSEITEGTPEELRQLLTDRLGSKFEMRK